MLAMRGPPKGLEISDRPVQGYLYKTDLSPVTFLLP